MNKASGTCGTLSSSPTYMESQKTEGGEKYLKKQIIK